MVLQSLQSPLLWLQETNTDVWEYLMISLVKVRKNKVLEEMKEAWKKTYSSIENINDYNTVNLGRVLLKNIKRGWFSSDTLYPLHENSNMGIRKYFVYGFQFFTWGGYRTFQNSYVPHKMELVNCSTVVNVLEVLARLNDFEFTIDDNTTIQEVVKFLYERENLRTDKHIFCSIKNEIMSLE